MKADKGQFDEMLRGMLANAVKAAVHAEIHAHTAERKAKGGRVIVSVPKVNEKQVLRLRSALRRQTPLRMTSKTKTL